MTASDSPASDPLRILVADDMGSMRSLIKVTGPDVLQRVRSNERPATLPFITLTGTTKADLIKQPIDAGVSDYLAEPFRPEALLEKVQRVPF